MSRIYDAIQIKIPNSALVTDNPTYGYYYSAPDGYLRWVSGRPQYDGTNVPTGENDFDTWSEGIYIQPNGDSFRGFRENLENMGEIATFSSFNFSVNDTDDILMWLDSNNLNIIGAEVKRYIVINDEFKQVWQGVVYRLDNEDTLVRFECVDSFISSYNNIPTVKTEDGENVPVTLGFVENAKLVKYRNDENSLYEDQYSTSSGTGKIPQVYLLYDTDEEAVDVYNLLKDKSVFIRYLDAEDNNNYYECTAVYYSDVGVLGPGINRSRSVTLVIETDLTWDDVMTQYGTIDFDGSSTGTQIYYSRVEVLFSATPYVISTKAINKIYSQEIRYELSRDLYKNANYLILSSDTDIYGGNEGAPHPGFGLINIEKNDQLGSKRYEYITPKEVEVIPFTGGTGAISNNLIDKDWETFELFELPSGTEGLIVEGIKIQVTPTQNMRYSDFDQMYLHFDFTVEGLLPSLTELDLRVIITGVKDGAEFSQYTVGNFERISFEKGVSQDYIFTQTSPNYYDPPRPPPPFGVSIDTNEDKINERLTCISKNAVYMPIYTNPEDFENFDQVNATITIDKRDGVGLDDLRNALTIKLRQVCFTAEVTGGASGKTFYSRVNGEDFLPLTSPGTYTPENIIKHLHLYYNNIPLASINTHNLDTSRSDAWVCGRQITSVNNSLDYINSLIRDTFICMYPSRDGVRSFNAWRDDPTIVKAFSSNDGSILYDANNGYGIRYFKKTSNSNVIGSLDLKYHWDDASSSYIKSIGLRNADQSDMFPNPEESEGTDNTLTGYISAGQQLGVCEILTGVEPSTLSPALEVGSYLSLFGSATYNLYFWEVKNIEDLGGGQWRITAINTDFNSDNTLYIILDGSVYYYDINQPKWKTFAPGFESYTEAQSQWQILRSSYEKTGTIKPLEDSLGECPWFIDISRFPEETALQGNNAAILKCRNIVEYMSRQKYLVTFDIPLTLENIGLELSDRVTFSDIKYTGGQAIEGYITQIKLPRELNRLVISVILEPTDLVQQSTIYESGDRTDDIIESGSQGDNYLEG